MWVYKGVASPAQLHLMELSLSLLTCCCFRRSAPLTSVTTHSSWRCRARNWTPERVSDPHQDWRQEDSGGRCVCCNEPCSLKMAPTDQQRHHRVTCRFSHRLLLQVKQEPEARDKLHIKAERDSNQSHNVTWLLITGSIIVQLSIQSNLILKQFWGTLLQYFSFLLLYTTNIYIYKLISLL